MEEQEKRTRSEKIIRCINSNNIDGIKSNLEGLSAEDKADILVVNHDSISSENAFLEAIYSEDLEVVKSLNLKDLDSENFCKVMNGKDKHGYTNALNVLRISNSEAILSKISYYDRPIEDIMPILDRDIHYLDNSLIFNSMIMQNEKIPLRYATTSSDVCSSLQSGYLSDSGCSIDSDEAVSSLDNGLYSNKSSSSEDAVTSQEKSKFRILLGDHKLSQEKITDLCSIGYGYKNPLSHSGINNKLMFDDLIDGLQGVDSNKALDIALSKGCNGKTLLHYFAEKSNNDQFCKILGLITNPEDKKKALTTKDRHEKTPIDIVYESHNELNLKYNEISLIDEALQSSSNREFGIAK